MQPRPRLHPTGTAVLKQSEHVCGCGVAGLGFACSLITLNPRRQDLRESRFGFLTGTELEADKTPFDADTFVLDPVRCVRPSSIASKSFECVVLIPHTSIPALRCTHRPRLWDLLSAEELSMCVR